MSAVPSNVLDFVREARRLVRARPAAVAGAVLAAAAGGLWGYFLFWSAFGHVHRTYRLDWTVPVEDGARTVAARWISPPDEPLIGYYRKEFRAPGTIRSAWVQISGPFTFSFYINGRRIGGDYYKSGRATGLFDITRQVVPGRNVIAITNTSRTYDETSRVVVSGAITDWQGHVVPLLSDETWKAFPRYARQIQKQGRPEWFEPLFDASYWPHAVARGTPGADDVASTDFPHDLMRDPVPLQWVWGSRPAAEEVYFRFAFPAHGRVRDAWLRLAVRHSYEIFVNGHRLEAEETEETGVVDTPDLTSVDIYNITPYLGRGRNVVAVKARRGALDHGLIADGFWTDAAGLHRFSSSSPDWKASETYQAGWVRGGFDDRTWTAAAPLRLDSGLASVSFTRNIVEVDPPRSFLFETYLWLVLLELLGAAVYLALAWAAARLTGPREAAGGLAAAGLATLPSVVFLLTVWLLGYDYRFDIAFSFQPIWVAAALLLCIAFLGLLVAWDRGRRTIPRWVPGETLAALPAGTARAGSWVWRHRYGLALLVVLAVGTVLRLQHVAFEPIGADEIKMLEKSKGILTLGFPHVIVAEELGVRLATTSEIVHYPMAATILLFGENELALRIPGIIFSILTIPLLYRFGQVIHSRLSGLLAATLFALLPSVIRMSQLARYPAQLTFFTLLTVYFFWRCISREDIANRYLWYTTAAYLAAYLSWEGAGFMIPSLFVGLVAARPRDLHKTLSTPRLVGCLFFIALVIVLQLNIRAMVSEDLYIYGTGTSELTLVPTWNHSNFQAFYYVDNFFLIENHQVMSWLCLLGIPLALGRNTLARALRFLYAIGFMNLFMKTCFLQIRNWRYIYNLIPMLCLVSSVVLLTFIGYLARLVARSGALRAPARALRSGVAGAAVVLVLLSSSSFVLHLYELPGTHGLPRTRMEDRYYPTIQEAVGFMERHLEDDDIIISPVPHLVDFYIRDADYFLQTIMQFQVFLNPTRDTTMHRVSGTQAILTFKDLQKVIATHHRVWYVTSPLDEKLLDEQTQEWISENMEVVYENIASLVYLSRK